MIQGYGTKHSWAKISFANFHVIFIVYTKFALTLNLLITYTINGSTKSFNLTLYVPCIILQCVDEPTRCTASYK